MNDQLISLGVRLKKIRKERGLTLQALADITQLTAGLLSKIENFRTIPSIMVLLEIARALEIDLSELFSGISFSPAARMLLVRADEHRQLEREEGRPLDYAMIMELPLAAVNLQMMLVTLIPQAACPPVTTEADEFFYILSGSCRYRVGTEVFELHPGDALWFDGAQPHAPEVCDAEVRILVLYLLREQHKGSSR